MFYNFLAATVLHQFITLEDGKYLMKLPPLDQHSNHLYYVIDHMLNNGFYEDGFHYSSYILKYLHLVQDQGNFSASKLVKGLSNLMIRISYKLWNAAMKFEQSFGSVSSIENFKTTLKYRTLSVLCLGEGNCSFEEVVDRAVKSSLKFQKDCGVTVDYFALINHFEHSLGAISKRFKVLQNSECSLTETSVMSLLEFGQHLGTVYRKAGKVQDAGLLLGQLQKNLINVNIEEKNSNSSLRRVLEFVPCMWKIMLEFSFISIQKETKKLSKKKSDCEILEGLVDDANSIVTEGLTKKDLSHSCLSVMLDSLENLKSFLHSSYNVCHNGQCTTIPYTTFVKIVSLFLNCVKLLKLQCQLIEAKFIEETNAEQRKLLGQKHQKLCDRQLALFTFLALQYQGQFQALGGSNSSKATDLKRR